MSRIGKKPIIIPKGVTIKVESGEIVVKGPKGELKQEVHPIIAIEQKENELFVTAKKLDTKLAKSLWGTFRSIIANMIVGVTEGHEKKLEINGVGYKAELKGNLLVLNVGYSHPVEYKPDDSVKVEVDKNIITVSGIDKHMVGETAAQIRKVRKPEPYKGKGIRYIDEVVRRKAGKALKGAGDGA